jgi:uncharacterized protein
MVDLSAVRGFQWDDGNARKSEENHGVSQDEAEQVFANEPLTIAPDARHSQRETRYYALGHTNEGRCLFVSFTLRDAGLTLRVISARAMNRKERAIYEAQA